MRELWQRGRGRMQGFSEYVYLSPGVRIAIEQANSKATASLLTPWMPFLFMEGLRFIKNEEKLNPKDTSTA